MWPSQYMGRSATSSMPFGVGAYLTFIRWWLFAATNVAATNRRMMALAFRLDSSIQLSRCCLHADATSILLRLHILMYRRLVE
jgi:hypothetical protein